ncbi:MAG TPA: AEC family transporter [Thermohalobaculum sp.]|nr:AEC family transporter [Thermohalobaculum sp.]
MSAAGALLTIVMPVFLVVGAGYLSVRIGLFADAGVDALVRFASGVAVPVLLFRAMYRLDLGAALDVQHLVSFYAGAAVCFVGAILLARLVWKRRPGEAVAIGFLAFFSNTVLLGLPIIERAYGPRELEAAYAIIAMHAPFGYLVGIMTMELSRRDGAPVAVALRRTATAMFHNALTIGLALGLCVNLLGIDLWEPVEGAVDMLARAALPVALFGLGGVLTRYALKREVGEALMASAFSLIVHPFVAWVLAAQVFGLPEPFVRAAVVIAAMPTGVNGYIFAEMYGRAVGTAASSVLLATLLSVLTITAWLAFLGGAALG